MLVVLEDKLVVVGIDRKEYFQVRLYRDIMRQRTIGNRYSLHSVLLTPSN